MISSVSFLVPSVPSLPSIGYISQLLGIVSEICRIIRSSEIIRFGSEKLKLFFFRPLPWIDRRLKDSKIKRTGSPIVVPWYG